MQVQARIVAGAGFVFGAWLLGAGVASASPVLPEDEAGIEVEASVLPATWAEGKVEPAATAAALEAQRVDVLVTLSPEPSGLEEEPEPVDLEAVKAPYRARIRDLADELRGIEREYRPTESLGARDERRAVVEMRESLTPVDEQALQDLRLEIDFQRDLMRTAVAQATRRDLSSAKAAVAAEIERLGGVVKPESHPSGVAASVPASALAALARHPRVRQVLLDRPTDYELDVSVSSAQYDAWWTGGFDGGASDFGLVDTGVQQDHPAFAGVVFYSDSGTTDTDPTEGHGTHVAGIAASADATYKGGAHGLDAVVWTTAGPAQSGTMSGMDWLVTGAGQSPEVVNHSLGYGSSNGSDYGTNDSFYDALVESFDVMVTKSAGNSGWSDTDPTLTFPGTAYNILTIANMDDQNTTGRSDDVRRTSSSVGPTEGGRKKPDITAPGTFILSTNSGWATAADFVSKSGTSMAAPHVGAAIVLMEDGGNFTPMAQKAVLINTADAWDSNDTSVTTDDGPVTGSSWDKSYGWGYLDMGEAHFNRGDYFLGSVIGRNDDAVDDDYKLYAGSMFADEKATLVWEKRAQTYVAGAPATNPYALTDINVRLYDEADGSLVGSDLGGIDNVHQVAAAASIDAVIKVYAWTTILDGAASESFALATEENFAAVSPPVLELGSAPPAWVGPFQSFSVDVTVQNLGGVAAHDTTVTLTDVAGLTGGSAQNLGTIDAAGNDLTAYDLTTSGLAAGVQVVPISASSASYDETYTGANSVSLNVEATPPTSGCTASGTASSSPIPVPWTASDTQTGVESSDLYVTPPAGGPFVWTGLSATGTSGNFSYVATGGDGVYEFAVRAVDVGGNWEAIPTSAECVVTLPEPGQLMMIVSGIALLGRLDRRRRRA